MPSKIRAIMLIVAVLGIFGSASARADGKLESPFFDNVQINEGPWAVMIFGGQLTENELADIIFYKPEKGTRFTDTSFVGATVSKEVFRWKGFSVDAELGAGYQFGEFRGVDNSAAQVWGAAYFRYDDFPWNHLVKTSVATSVGINVISEKTAFENFETKDGDTVSLLHYFSPEITFALPQNPYDELVIRLHHRSSANGAFGCTGCGSNFVTLGIRHKF